MATIATQNMTRDSAVEYRVPTGTGDEFENDGQVFLWVFNDHGSTVIVTITAVRVCDQGFIDDDTHNIIDGGLTIVGSFNRYRFNQFSGRVKFSLSVANDNIGVAAVRAPVAIVTL